MKRGREGRFQTKDDKKKITPHCLKENRLVKKKLLVIAFIINKNKYFNLIIHVLRNYFYK